MKRSKLIRRVYFELRQSLGTQATQRETLRCAAALVRLYLGETDEAPLDARTGGIPFSMWPLDAAYADGGWRVMRYEASSEIEMRRQEALELKMHNGLARLKRGLL